MGGVTKAGGPAPMQQGPAAAKTPHGPALRTLTEEQKQQATEGKASLYEVVKGDTLWGIAKRNGVSLADLKEANPELFTAQRKSGDLIFPGDQVVVPKSKGWSPRGEVATRPDRPAAQRGTPEAPAPSGPQPGDGPAAQVQGPQVQGPQGPQVQGPQGGDVAPTQSGGVSPGAQSEAMQRFMQVAPQVEAAIEKLSESPEAATPQLLAAIDSFMTEFSTAPDVRTNQDFVDLRQAWSEIKADLAGDEGGGETGPGDADEVN